MLVIAIPPIAAALVKGGEVGLQAVAGLVSAPKTAERQATDNAKGNESVGQWNTAPTMREGSLVRTQVGSDGVNTIAFADGTTAIDASGMQHRMNLRLNAGSRMSAALQQQSEQAETAAVGNMVAAAASTAAALQQSADFVRSHAKGERAGTHWGLSDAAGFTQAVTQAQKLTESFARKHGLDQKQAAQILGMAEFAAQNPKVLDLVSPVGVKAAAEATGTSEAAAKQLLEDARNFVKEAGFSDAVERIRRATRDATFDTSDESSRRAMEGIRASFDQSQQHTDQASASLQKSMAFKEAATRARENSGAWETGLLRQFVDWMGIQQNAYTGRNFDGATVAQMAEKNPELLTPFIERFFKERVEPMLSTGVGEVKTVEDVLAFFERGKAGVSGTSDIAAQGRKLLDEVRGVASNAGVDPGKRVRSQLPQQVSATQGRAEQAVRAGRGRVQTEGRPLEDKARNQTAPGSQPLLGMAATNAIGQIFPDEVSALMKKKIPGLNMTVGVPGSAVMEAGAERSQQGRPRDPVKESLSKIDDAIDRGVSAVLPEPVNQALEQTKAFMRQKIGEMIGTRQELPVSSSTRQPRANAQAPVQPVEARSVSGFGQAADQPGAGNPLTGVPGQSNLGKLFGGGQRPIPTQSQPAEGAGERRKDDAPPSAR